MIRKVYDRMLAESATADAAAEERAAVAAQKRVGCSLCHDSPPVTLVHTLLVYYRLPGWG